MIELGTGQLSWHASERRNDRYGTVGLWVDASPVDPETTDRIAWSAEGRQAEGKKGVLIAYVIETRDSQHVGDLMRDIHPVKPEVDEQIELGSGTLFFQQIDDDVWYVGLRPDNDRPNDWLDPHELYRVHQQTVRLCFALADGQ